MKSSSACVLLACTLVPALGAGCTHFRETHYFKSVNARGEPVNYYRLDVSGQTYLSSSRFLSGYFDESAVDAYFSEFVQPENARFQPGGAQSGGGAGTGAQEVEVRSMNANLDNRRLVLLLSTNTDAVAQGIQSIAQNEAIGALLARVVGRERLAEAREALGELARSAAAAKAVALAGDRLLADMPEAADQALAGRSALEYANRLIVYLGGQPVGSLDEAAAWLEANRARLHATLLNE